jgi:hypothetical protein
MLGGPPRTSLAPSMTLRLPKTPSMQVREVEADHRIPGAVVVLITSEPPRGRC